MAGPYDDLGDIGATPHPLGLPNADDFLAAIAAEQAPVDLAPEPPRDPFLEAMGSAALDAVSGAAPFDAPPDVVSGGDLAAVPNVQAEPAPWEVDAISGGRKPPELLEPDWDAEDPQPSSPELLEPTLDDAPSELLEPPDTGEGLADQYAGMSADARLKLFAEEDVAKDSYFAERQGELLEGDRRAAEENEARWQLARNEAARESSALREDIQRLSETTIDNDRWMDSRTGGQTVAMYLSAIIGGVLGASRAGRNTAIDAIVGSIDRDIASQKADIANQRTSLGQRKSLLGELRQTNADEFQASEAARLVRLRQADQMLANEAAKYDPQGTAARRIFEGRQELQRKQAEGMAAVEETVYKRSMAIADQDIKRAGEMRQQRKQNLEREKWDAEVARKARRGSGKPKKPKKPEWREIEAARKAGYFWDDNSGKFVKDPNFSGKPEDEMAELNKENIRARTKKTELESSEGERSRQFGTRLKSKDGKEILLGSAGEATAFRNARGQLDTLSGLIDEMVIMRDQEGFSSATLKGEEWQKMSSTFRQMQLEAKDVYQLGVLAGEDLNLINGVFATSDPTEVRDMISGLDAARKGMVNRFNNRLGAAVPIGEEAERYEPPRKTRTKAKKEETADVLESVGQGIRPDIVVLAPTDPKRKAAVAAERARVEAQVKKEKDPWGMRQTALNLQERVDAGEMTIEEAIDIASPLGRRVAERDARRIGKEHKSEIMEMSPDELKTSTKPWLVEMRRLEDLADPASQHPAWRKDVYEYLIKGPN